MALSPFPKFLVLSLLSVWQDEDSLSLAIKEVGSEAMTEKNVKIGVFPNIYVRISVKFSLGLIGRQPESEFLNF
jgi:hypothetical protein